MTPCPKCLAGLGAMARQGIELQSIVLQWHGIAWQPFPPTPTPSFHQHRPASQDYISCFNILFAFFVPCIANQDELRNDMCLSVLRVSSGFLLLSSQRSAKITSKWPRLPSSKLEPRFRRRYGQSEQWLSCVAGRPGLWLWRSQWCTYSLETRTMKRC